jgi:hypothetical protein
MSSAPFKYVFFASPLGRLADCQNWLPIHHLCEVESDDPQKKMTGTSNLRVSLGCRAHSSHVINVFCFKDEPQQFAP